jgi:hypothetical protein
MSQLFAAIAKFYGGTSLPKAKFSDMAFASSNVSRSLVDGSSIDLNHFDGCIDRKIQIPQTNREDSAQCLSQIATAIRERLARMEQSEIDALDRMTQMINGIDARSLT